jgi:hypothetical protein
MLRNALVLLLAVSPAFAGEGLSDFNLNSVHARDLLDHTLNPEIYEGIRAYDMTPGAPQPECLTEDGKPFTGHSVPRRRAAATRPEPEFYPLYDGQPGLPPPLSRAGYVQLASSTRIKVDKRRGELTVAFPDVVFAGGAFGDRADLFVRMTGTTDAPAISWAAVLCSGGGYLGYKGSTVTLPEKSGSYNISETMALGTPKALIMKTHRWLTEGMVATEDLCTDAFREKMKDSRVTTLPPALGPYALVFDPKKNTLKVKWENK